MAWYMFLITPLAQKVEFMFLGIGVAYTASLVQMRATRKVLNDEAKEDIGQTFEGKLHEFKRQQDEKFAELSESLHILSSTNTRRLEETEQAVWALYTLSIKVLWLFNANLIEAETSHDAKILIEQLAETATEVMGHSAKVEIALSSIEPNFVRQTQQFSRTVLDIIVQNVTTAGELEELIIKREHKTERVETEKTFFKDLESERSFSERDKSWVQSELDKLWGEVDAASDDVSAYKVNLKSNNRQELTDATMRYRTSIAEVFPILFPIKKAQ